MTVLGARSTGTASGSGGSGGSWAGLPNVNDGAPGTNPGTYATWSSIGPQGVGFITCSVYDFSAIRDIDTLNSVTVVVRHHENNTSLYSSITVQVVAQSGTILAPTAFTRSTTDIDSSVTFNPTLADLKSLLTTGFTRVTGTRTTQNTNSILSVDHVDLFADYTAVPGQGSATVTWTDVLSASGVQPAKGEGTAVVNTSWDLAASGPTPVRNYGDLTYGDGTYGGPKPVWDSLQGPFGPAGFSDLALRRPVVGQVAFQSGWSNYGSGYNNVLLCRDYQGVCTLTGLVLGPTSFAASSVPLYLPFGFRPLNRVMHIGYAGDPNTGVRIDIQPDGGVVFSQAAISGATYILFDSLWATPVPTSYVIEGCAPISMARGTGSNYTLTVSRGFYMDLSLRVSAVAANLAGTFAGHATAGNWNIVTIWHGLVLCLNTDPAGAAWTSEGAAMISYYNNCVLGTAWQDHAVVATFQSTGAGVVPTFYDRRWLPWQTTYPTQAEPVVSGGDYYTGTGSGILDGLTPDSAGSDSFDGGPP